MKLGDTVLVIPSAALSKLRLDELAGKKGKVVEISKHSNKVLGCWVKFPFKHLDEREWFIPYNSIGM